MAAPWHPLEPDITWLTDTLATGGDLQADHRQAAEQCNGLRKQGVTHIIDLRAEFDDLQRYRRFLGPGVSIFHFGVDDPHGGTDHPASWWESIYTTAQEALTVPGARLFVHCHVGMNRGPSAAFMLLCSPLFGLSVADAFQLVRRRRHIAYMAYAEQAVSWLADQSWSSVEKSDILTLTELRLKPTYQWTDALTNEVNYRSNRKAPR